MYPPPPRAFNTSLSYLLVKMRWCRSRGDETRVLKPLASEDRALSVRGEHLICTKNTRGGRVFLSCLFAREDEALLVGRGGMHPDVRNPWAARKSLEP